MTITRTTAEDLLVEAEMEVGRFAWEGTFADYLQRVIDDPSISRLSHKLVYDSILAEGVDESPRGSPVYKLFEDKIFGLDDVLERVVQYFASSSRRLEIRKRILLLLGPPAGGKSSIVALMKEAMERFTRTDEGTVYAIKDCPMQEEPLHLIPHQLRPKLMRDHKLYIEGDLCPKCRYMVRTRFQGRISEVPITRVVFSEQEAIGIGYYVATNPNPTDATLLVGSMDTSQLEGDRLEVAGKAYRMDGEFNVANRGLMEFVEIFKGDKHLLTTLLGLAQEQLIKMDRFGSVYADEVIVGHSNEGDFTTFQHDESSEALRDRIIAIQIPYNLKVSEEVKIYQKMLRSSGLEDVHIPPLTLPVMSIFAVLTRLEPAPLRQGISLVEKLRLYNDRGGEEHVLQLKRQHPSEGMKGISPRFVMNRLSSSASATEVRCVSPLGALDSLWQGRQENVTLSEEEKDQYIDILKDTVEEYSKRAKQEVQRAFEESFEQTAEMMHNDYLANVAAYCTGEPLRDGTTGVEREFNEPLMREMERHMDVNERSKGEFRREINKIFSMWKRRGLKFDYTSEPRIRKAIEDRLFPDDKKLQNTLSEPKPEREKVEWARKRRAIFNRLKSSYGYCDQCAEDIIEYVLHVLRRRPVIKALKNEGIEWQWDRNPPPPPSLPVPE